MNIEMQGKGMSTLPIIGVSFSNVLSVKVH